MILATASARLRSAPAKVPSSNVSRPCRRRIRRPWSANSSRSEPATAIASDTRKIRSEARSAAIADFQGHTEQLGIGDKVTLFTASDFNRTYNSNGKGSDHAWGGHHMVVGGAVNGGRLYGEVPILQTSGPDDTGSRGAWIPKVSTDEMAATLARWFGVGESDLPLILPNIGRFARPDLGFMNF